MLPTILPQSVLRLEQLPSKCVEPGDIICYLSKNGKVFAHRVVGRSISREGVLLEIKGDAQEERETLAASPVTSVVRRVSHPLLSYDTDSEVGRLLSWFVLSHSQVSQRAGKALHGCIRAVVAARSLKMILGPSARPKPT